ncbi:GntR family transcriptional regulator [Dendrosporobacter sp. 1207_IL3150]|uniref:GntR family transcriptional regulator n=1 Tax=Dendrosporobacter sp. 1207_IL3150 TaxID=3084054 RepID=UPI002FDB6F2F
MINFKIDSKLKYQTIPNMVTDVLREAILNGELKGGQQLKQDELGGILHVSLSPVREALKNLEAEGLVKFYPNRGAVVTDLSSDEAQEIFEIRLFLESGALELSIPKLTETDFTKAKQLLAKTDNEKSHAKLGELNWRFHEALYQGAQKPRLMKLINVMHNNVERYMRLYLITLNFQAQSHIEHYALLEACINRDIEKAQMVLRKHMEAASKSLITYLEK